MTKHTRILDLGGVKNKQILLFLASYISEQNENLPSPMLKLRNPTLHIIRNTGPGLGALAAAAGAEVGQGRDVLGHARQAEPRTRGLLGHPWQEAVHQT